MYDRQTDHHAPRALAARFAWLPFLTVALASGLAHAAADVRTEYADGSLRGPQVYAGEGFHSVGLVNESAEAVTFNVYRLHDGVGLGAFEQTDATLQAALQAQTDASVAAMQAFMEQADALGGTVVKARDETDMFVDLEEGTYVVSASVDGNDASKPVYTSFMVTEGGDQGTAPEVANVVHLSDFAFDFPATIAAGENLWEVSNTGAQPHIAAFFKLLPGKTTADLEAFLNGATDESTPPPFDTGTDLSIEALTPGATVYLPLDFSAGTWVAVCFVPDMHDPSTAHYMEGMIEEFVVD
ncbi:MAG: hypothetical protein KF875_00495 [Trueperaceae bacterium]|nr:hypothetical protein [Trueperaceae bacterium]MCC6310410.1 hypothetical protein [Trueperaceae bacterium]MCO5172592.1 hypothetical protein [Trueperaceae bacterium]MCW5819139.1 hypothetical protein [Trueperaceae bacterium]